MSTKNFKQAQISVAKAFVQLSQNELFRVNVEGQDIWDAYLAAFPEGTNPIFRTRTEHDGSYDRSFIRRLGNVVSVSEVDGSLKSFWTTAASTAPAPYDAVFYKLAEIVEASEIANVFRIKEAQIGNNMNTETLADGTSIDWYHFNAQIDRKHRSNDIDAELGKARENVEMVRRSYEELKPEAVKEVLQLIQEGNLYRGAEHRNAVEGFERAQKIYLRNDARKRAAVLWLNHNARHMAIRSTVIGTLIEDLSKGIDTEQAVRSFEAKVAPQNYKRPTALVTQGMVDKAVEKIEELGLENSLQRRMATIEDVSVNNVLWVNGEAQKAMQGGVAELLQSSVTKRASAKNATEEEITMDDFISKVLPKANSVEVYMSNQQEKNLVTLTTALHADAPNLFKWSNPFAWSYNGNTTDTIKERVKAAGGNVDAPVRVSLSWYNHDDLDLHATQSPAGIVYFAMKAGTGRCGGRILDVDANAGYGSTNTPVENLAFTENFDGDYRIKVNQYSRRSTGDLGFAMQIVVGDIAHELTYDKAVSGDVSVASFTVNKGKLENFKLLDKDIRSQSASRVSWEVQTETFVPVETVMLSPNFWDGQTIGNKHWFFILKGCNNPESTRGIYNEFLTSSLEEHRKVFEVLGNKTKCESTEKQLSGVGFSSTNRGSVRIRVKGPKINQTYLVTT